MVDFEMVSDPDCFGPSLDKVGKRQSRPLESPSVALWWLKGFISSYTGCLWTGAAITLASTFMPSLFFLLLDLV